MDIIIIVAVLRSTLRQSIPITLGSLSGLFCERVGIINIAIEGMMLTAAFTGFMTNVFTGNLPLSILIAMLTGGLLGLLHAWLSIRFKVDQIISGTVINILAVGLTGYFYTPGAVTEGKLQTITIPLLADIPVIFLTARDETSEVVRGFAAGGVDYVVKPFHQEEVLARVDAHVKINRLTRDLQQQTEALEREIEERRTLSRAGCACTGVPIAFFRIASAMRSQLGRFSSGVSRCHFFESR